MKIDKEIKKDIEGMLGVLMAGAGASGSIFILKYGDSLSDSARIILLPAVALIVAGAYKYLNSEKAEDVEYMIE